MVTASHLEILLLQQFPLLIGLTVVPLEVVMKLRRFSFLVDAISAHQHQGLFILHFPALSCWRPYC